MTQGPSPSLDIDPTKSLAKLRVEIYERLQALDAVQDKLEAQLSLLRAADEDEDEDPDLVLVEDLNADSRRKRLIDQLHAVWREREHVRANAASYGVAVDAISKTTNGGLMQQQPNGEIIWE